MCECKIISIHSPANNLSASERKKLARKQRKALAKAEAKAQEEKKGKLFHHQYSLAKVFYVENKPQGKQANTDEDKKSKDDQKVKLDPQKLVSVSMDRCCSSTVLQISLSRLTILLMKLSSSLLHCST